MAAVTWPWALSQKGPMPSDRGHRGLCPKHDHVVEKRHRTGRERSIGRKAP